MLIAQLCDFGKDGDARYQIHEPSQALAQVPDVTAIDIHFYHRHLPWCVEHADILVLQFVNDWDLLAICSDRRRRGLVTLFKTNDDFFDLQPWNPIAAAWANREVQELYRQLLRQADGVQTSSAVLAERCRALGAQILAVFPNHLTRVPDLQPLPERHFTVGWAGSPGHFADLMWIAPALHDWLRRHPGTRLALMGNELVQSFFNLPPERLLFQPFGSLEQYLGFLRQLDVGLAPLLPTR